MNKSGLEQYIVRHPDFIPEGQEHLYPAMGGVFHDFIPDHVDTTELFGDEADDTRLGPLDDAGVPKNKKKK